MILFEKFGQHQPLNRQSERYRREGIDLSVSTLADQVGACTMVLQPLHALIERHALSAERLPSSGSLAAKLRMRCARQRWRADRGKQTSIALMMPGAPSEVTSSGSARPRRFMSSKNAVTVSASSFDPAIRCSNTRRPST